MKEVNMTKLTRALKTALNFPLINPEELNNPAIVKRHGFITQGLTDPNKVFSIMLTFDTYSSNSSELPCLHFSISENGTYDGYSTKLYFKPKITNDKELQAWFNLFFSEVYPGYEKYVEKEEIDGRICTHFRLYFDEVGGKPVVSNFRYKS